MDDDADFLVVIQDEDGNIYELEFDYFEFKDFEGWALDNGYEFAVEYIG